jgi:hypothetical protein
MGRIKLSALIALGALLLPASGRAQGCILCYTSLANGGPGALRAFQLGMLALLAPALLLCITFAALIYHRARVASGGTLPSFTSLFCNGAGYVFRFGKASSSSPDRIRHSVPDAVQLSDSHLGI